MKILYLVYLCVLSKILFGYAHLPYSVIWLFRLEKDMHQHFLRAFSVAGLVPCLYLSVWDYYPKRPFMLNKEVELMCQSVTWKLKKTLVSMHVEVSIIEKTKRRNKDAQEANNFGQIIYNPYVINLLIIVVYKLFLSRSLRNLKYSTSYIVVIGW